MLPLGGSIAGDGRRIVVEGRVFDAAGEPVSDALIETWQANADGAYPTWPAAGIPAGFVRLATGPGGEYTLATVKPGRVPAPGEGLQAPHIVVSVFARGLLRRLVTRIYFPDEQRANAVDPVLLSIEDAGARATLIASESGAAHYRFDIHLRGEKETAFFAL
jgi:protocatechuate 3,4-dioxygenase alpha subunit